MSLDTSASIKDCHQGLTDGGELKGLNTNPDLLAASIRPDEGCNGDYLYHRFGSTKEHIKVVLRIFPPLCDRATGWPVGTGLFAVQP